MICNDKYVISNKAESSSEWPCPRRVSYLVKVYMYVSDIFCYFHHDRDKHLCRNIIAVIS